MGMVQEKLYVRRNIMQIAPNLRILVSVLGRYVIGVSSQELHRSSLIIRSRRSSILTEKEIGNKQKVTQEKENWIRMANLWLMNRA